MRIWSLHPKYLDTKGLVALWRETLLAKHVLEGKTKGYTNHPQLSRFKGLENPLHAINNYLAEVHAEASARNYTFNKEKIDWNFTPCKLTVTKGQLEYETAHLLRKLNARDKKKYKEVKAQTNLNAHPIFKIIKGNIEDWEII